MKTTFIYGLYSERNDEIRYVGKSNDPKNRLRMHIYESKYTLTKTHKCDWIRHEINNGNKVNYLVLEECEFDLWPEREIYWIHQFDNLTNTSKGGKGGSPLEYKMTYEELYEWRKNNVPSYINSIPKWKSYIKTNNIIGIPINPNKVYKNNGWISWSKFLDTMFLNPDEYKNIFLPFHDFKEWLKDKQFKNSVEFKKYIDKPNFIPYNPERFYKEWTKWCDVLAGSKDTNKKYWDYDTCKKFLFENYGGLTLVEFRKLSKNNELPREIPKKPERVFENFTASDFLSNYKKFPKSYYYNYKESIKIVHTLNIKTNSEWRIKCKDKNWDKRIPTSPDYTYSDEWTSWYDWLGTK